MPKQFTFQVKIDTSKIQEDTNRIRSLIEAAFLPIQFKMPEFNQTAKIEAMRSELESVGKVDLSRPVEDLQADIRATEELISKLEARLNDTFFKGGFGSQASEAFKSNLNDYLKQVENEFGTTVANRIRATGQIRLGDVGKQFINDTAAPDEIGRTQSAFRAVQEKKQFTIAEQKAQLELEAQIEDERIRVIQLQRAVNTQEFQQLEREISALSKADQDRGARDLLANSYTEYEATNKRMIEEELKSVSVLQDRKRRITELDSRLNATKTPAATITGERVTALTVTEKSATNAQNLAIALQEAAKAQLELAEATKQTASNRNDTGIDFERKRLELQRQSAKISEEQVQQTRIEAAEKLSAIRVTSAAQIEANRDQARAAREAATGVTVNTDKAQREELTLSKLREQVRLENQLNQVALSGLREQMAQAERLSQVRIAGAREEMRISEQKRQQELTTARSGGISTTNIEARHTVERANEEKKLQAIINETNIKRLQFEQTFEQASSREIVNRLQGEAKIANAVERVARARLVAAQLSTQGTTSDARVAAEERVRAAVESVSNAERTRLAIEQNLSTQTVAAEERIATATQRVATERIRAEERIQAAQQRTLAAQSRPAPGGGGGNLLGGLSGAARFLTGGFAALAGVQLARQINNAVQGLDTLRVEAARAKVGLDVLSGSSEKAAANIAAIKSAGAGTIDTFNALKIGVQATALGLANTTDEFNRLTTAGRAVALVSPIIHDVNSALSEIALAGANQSFRRLDQLGLSVLEVKKRIAELQAETKGLNDQQAFSAAVIDVLNTKYGKLLQTTEAQASGQERLRTAWSDLKLALADSTPIKAADDALGLLAIAIRSAQAAASGNFEFFGAENQVLSQIERLRRLKTEGASLTEQFMAQLTGDTSALGFVSPDKIKNLESLIPIFQKLRDLQKQGAISTEKYQAELIQLAGQISEAKGVNADFTKEIGNFVLGLMPIEEVLSGSTQASKVYSDAVKALGTEFISSDKTAQGMLASLVKIQENFDNTGNQKAYIQGLNDTTEGFHHLTAAAIEFNEKRKEEQRQQLIGESQNDFVKIAQDQAAKLVEAGGNYDEALAILNRQKELIVKFFENLPKDIKPEDIPIYLAKLHVVLTEDPQVKVATVIEEQRKSLKDAVDSQAKSMAEAGASTDEIIKFQKDQVAKINAFLASLPKEITPEEIVVRAIQFRIDNIGVDPKKAIEDSVNGQVEAAVQGFVAKGLDPTTALQIVQDYGKIITDEVNKIPDGISGESYNQALEKVNANVAKGLSEIGKTVEFSTFDPTIALTKITDSLQNFNIPAFDNVEQLQNYRNELIELFDEIEKTGTVTVDQALRISELNQAADRAATGTTVFSAAVESLNEEFISGHVEARDLLSAMAGLETKYANGKSSIGEYAGAMSALVDSLIDVMRQAGFTGAALDGLLALKAKLATGTVIGLGGFQEGREAGTKQAEIVRIRDAEQARREERQAQKEAADEWKRTAERTAKAFEDSLGKVPGLFGTSSVTQDQLDLAKAGVPQNFADDFVRRLEDTVKHGVDWTGQGSNIAIAKEALGNVGVDASKFNDEQVLLFVKKMWADSSLFANEANLKLINADAAKASLDLQKKQAEGRQNIIDYISETFDVNVAAITGGEKVPGLPSGQVPAQTPLAGKPQTTIAQQQAEARLQLTIDEHAIDVAATKSAKLFEKVFTSYDFSAMANAPIYAIEISMTKSSTVLRVGNAGLSMANLLYGGFVRRTQEVDWIGSIVSAIEGQITQDVTAAVIATLSG